MISNLQFGAIPLVATDHPRDEGLSPVSRKDGARKMVHNKRSET